MTDIILHLFKEIEGFYPWKRSHLWQDILDKNEVIRFKCDWTENCSLDWTYFKIFGEMTGALTFNCIHRNNYIALGKILNPTHYEMKSYLGNTFIRQRLNLPLIPKTLLIPDYFQKDLKDLIVRLDVLVEEKLRPNSVSFILDLEKEVLDGKAHPN